MRRKKQDAPKRTEPQLQAMLEARFCPPQYAYIPHVRDATGFDASGTCDSLAMSLWPSRGLELVGFEIKSYRGDWIRELRKPHKAETFFRFCDRWYLVTADKGIVLPGELPINWGLMVPRGDTIVVEHEAPKLEPAPTDRSFLAGIMRRIHSIRPDILAIADASKVAKDEAIKEQASVLASIKDELNETKKSIQEFEAKAGIRIHQWDAGQVGEAVHLVMSGRLEISRELASLAYSAKKITAEAERLIAAAQQLDRDPAPIGDKSG